MELLIIVLLILLNGLLSMSEIALISVRKSRLESDAKRGNKAAATALKLANDPDRFFSTIQIGITLIGILTGLYSGEAFAVNLSIYISHIEPLQPYALTIAKVTIVIIVTYLTLVFGELVPKKLGIAAAESIAKYMAKPMNILALLGAPFVRLLSISSSLVIRLMGIESSIGGKITEEEIKAIIQEGTDGGAIQPVEQDIVARVFNLGDRDVDSIMTHRSELVWLNINDSKQQIIQQAKQHPVAIFPVSEDSLDQIIGVVYLNELFSEYIDSPCELKELIRPAHFLVENCSVYGALERLKKEGTQYGIVTDEFGCVKGIVTLKDILTALVGSICEVGQEPEITDRGNNSWLIDGQISFYDFLSHFDMEDLYTDNDYNTLSGLILSTLEHIPVVGERVHWSIFDIEIVDMDGARIDKVMVSINNNR